MAHQININCDMGESFGPWRLGNDAELMRYVPTINVACGFHAGDPHVMRRTVELAAEAGVEVGAHPALPDILGFGRRRLEISADELKDYVLYQVGALQGFARAAGLRLSHVKPHGALYAMCGEREDLALALLEAARSLDPDTIVIVGGPAVPAAAAATGVRAVPEGYVDLAYQPNGFPVLEREPVWLVRQVDVALGNRADAGGRRRRRHRGAADDHDRVRIQRARGLQQRQGQVLALAAHRVECAVRLDVAEPQPRGAGEALERADLVEDVILQLVRGDLQAPAPEPEDVRQGGVRADLDAGLRRQLDRPTHHVRVAGVEPARDVDGRDVAHQLGVVSEPPRSEALAHVAIDVDLVCHGVRSPSRILSPSRC